MPYQVQGIDLPSIFLAAQQARANEQAQQMNALRLGEMQRQAETQRWLPQARLDYAQGEPTDLLRLAPEEAMQLDRARAEQNKRQFEMALAAREAEAKRAGASLDEAAKIVVNQFGYQPGTDEFRNAYGMIREKLARQELETRRAGAQQINIGKEGNVGLERQVISQTQKAVMDDDALLGEISAMRGAMNAAGGAKNLVSYGAQAKGWLMGKVDKIAPDFTPESWKNLITAQKSFDSVVAAVRNKILNAYYGGAISEGEMKRGLQMLPDNETDSPTQFEAKMDAMEQRVARSRARGITAIVEGIEQNPAQTIGAQPASSLAPTDRVSNRNAAIREALTAGKTPQEIAGDLQKRGLMTPAEAEEFTRQAGTR